MSVANWVSYVWPGFFIKDKIKRENCIQQNNCQRMESSKNVVYGLCILIIPNKAKMYYLRNNTANKSLEMKS